MTILAALDEDRQSGVLSVAHDLAETYGDDLVVLHVVPKNEFESYKESVQGIDEFKDLSVTQEIDSAAQFARRSVSDVLGEFDSDVVTPRGRIGDPADEILAEAEKISPRFLVIGAESRSPVGKALFGNTTQTVLLNADVPVVTTLSE